MMINDRARREINSGHSRTWPVWKERLFGFRGTALLDQGFSPCRSQADQDPTYTRIQGPLRVTIHAPGMERSGSLIEYDYLGSSVSPTIEPITEEIAERILRGWSNHVLAAGLTPLFLPSLMHGGIACHA